MPRSNGEPTWLGSSRNEASILHLVSAVLIEQHDRWTVAGHHHLSEESMTLLGLVPHELEAKGVPLAIST